MISYNTKHEIKELAQQSQNEICGLIVNGNVFACKNISFKPTQHFEIAPEDYLQASLKGQINAVYHSHVTDNDTFSDYDKLNLYNHSLRGVLYNTKKNVFRYFLPEQYHNKYIGRQFKLGTNDCFGLVKNYYLNELNIQINNFPRNEDWYKLNPEIINQNFKSQGFDKVESMQKNDIIVFDLLQNGNPCHFGISLGNDTFLQHARNKLSTIDLLTSVWKKKIGYILRYVN